MVDALETVRAAERRSRRARDRRRLARRHRRDRRPARSAPGRGCTCCTARPRRGSAAPTWTASAGRSRATTTRCSRWTATSRTTRHRVPALRDAVRGGADLALGSRYVAGGGVVDWGLARRHHLARRLPLRAPPARPAGARPDGRLQVLRPAVLEAIDARRGERRGLRVPDRDDLPRAAARLRDRRGADHLQRPRRGGSKMSRRIVLEAAWRVRSCDIACYAAEFHARDQDNRPRRGIL